MPGGRQPTPEELRTRYGDGLGPRAILALAGAAGACLALIAVDERFLLAAMFLCAVLVAVLMDRVRDEIRRRGGGRRDSGAR